MQASLNVSVHRNPRLLEIQKKIELHQSSKLFFANINLFRTYQKIFEILEYCRLFTEFKCIFAAILQQGVLNGQNQDIIFFSDIIKMIKPLSFTFCPLQKIVFNEVF